MKMQSLTTDLSAQKESPAEQSGNYKGGILRWAAQMIAALVVFGVILFLSAGRINWLAGWIYLGMNAITQVLSALVLIPRQPGMLEERSKVRKGTKRYDHILAPAITIFGTLAVIITAGLDARFGWSGSISFALPGIVLAFGSQIFVLWAMVSNPFFSMTVRIQEDRGHQIISRGPYRLMRHPGYAGSLIYTLAIPLVLARVGLIFLHC